VIYQIYIRSFADADGDGIGDIRGITSRLTYLANLGVDAVWINPWYPSPMKDGGYDVAELRAIDPRFGSLDDAEEMIARAHALGLRVLLDIVPNHVSDEHDWFRAALNAPPGSAERDRFIFRPGRGPRRSLPPNDWQSEFGGPAWTRIRERDGAPGEWYLHLYSPEQPDLNWNNPVVHAEYEATLRFWFDLGVDGFRIDVAHGLAKADGLPDIGPGTWPPADGEEAGHPHWDRDDVHRIYRDWRAIADSYDEPRVFVAEAWVANPHRLAQYVRSDELHTAFNFDFLLAAWNSAELRRTIERTIASHDEVGAPPTWVLSNHDTARVVSRYARPQGARRLRSLADLLDLPSDFQLGYRRARAAALLMLALPGGAYIYQGEELGLAEVEDLPDDVLKDPTWEQSGHTDRGRDGARVPIPWAGSVPPFDFSATTATASPWLPQPDSWRELTAAAQNGDPQSMLELYRAALMIRRTHPALGDGELRWQEGRPETLAFTRTPGFLCLVNFSNEPVPIPSTARVLLSSAPLADDGGLPGDSTAWLDVRKRPAT
jgi:alpha-glucosidase